MKSRQLVLAIALVLVTGRILSSMKMDNRMNELFEAIVAEDGVVVYFPQRDRTTLPFGHLTPEILKRLNLLGIPLEHGLAIVASHVPHDLAIAEVLRDVGGCGTRVQPWRSDGDATWCHQGNRLAVYAV